MHAGWAGENVYQAVTDECCAERRLYTETVWRMEEEIGTGGYNPGDCFGCEKELSVRYGVGAAVIREAIRILERRGLGYMRSGPRGGFIVAQPALEYVSTSVAHFFRLSGLTVRQLWEARSLVDCLAARIAIERAHAKRLRTLSCPLPGDPLSRHLAFRSAVAQLTGNPAIVLFVECLNLLTRDFAALPANIDALHTAALDYFSNAISAIQARDSTLATSATEAANYVLEQHLTVPTFSDRMQVSRIPEARRQPRTRAEEVANHLALELASSPHPRARLGCESQLCERFGVGRLVLRQAIRILQDCGIAETRRGRGLGLLRCEPNPGAMIRLIGGYLLGSGLSDLDSGKMVCYLNVWMPVIAVARAGEKDRDQLQHVLAELRGAATVEWTAYLRLLRKLSNLADNPLIDLFSRCLIAHDARVQPTYINYVSGGAIRGYLSLCRDLLADPTLESSEGLARAKAQTRDFMVDLGSRPPI